MPDATPAARIEPQMARAIRAALGEHEGSLLAFLPGVAEIERTAEALGPLPAAVELHKLHGGIEPAAQRKALAAPPPGKRKLVLATSIAETSVTLEDVRIVVDSGLARRPRYDRGAGLTRLVTERASRAAVTQRAGRAARQASGRRHPPVGGSGDGVPTRARPAGNPRSGPVQPAADQPALGRGRSEHACPSSTRRPQPPRRGAAQTEVSRCDRRGGPRHRAWPRHRRLAARTAARAHASRCERPRARSRRPDVAVLLTERGLGGNDADLEVRWRRWRSDKSQRAAAARKLAARWRRTSRRQRCCRSRARLRQGTGPRLPRPLVAPPRRLGRALAVGRRARVPARPCIFACAQPVARRRGSRGTCLRRPHPVGCRDRRDGRPRAVCGTGSKSGTMANSIPRPAPSLRRAADALAPSVSLPAPIPRPIRRDRASLLEGVREHGLQCCRGTSAPASCAIAQLSRAVSTPQFRPCDEDMLLRADRGMAVTAPHRQAPAAGTSPDMPCAKRSSSFSAMTACARSTGSHRRISPARREASIRSITRRRGGTDGRSPRAGPVRPGIAPHRGRRPGAADPWRSPRPPAGRSRRRRTCRASGRAAGATSPRTCEAATPNIRGPTIPRRLCRHCGRSEQALSTGADVAPAGATPVCQVYRPRLMLIAVAAMGDQPAAAISSAR